MGVGSFSEQPQTLWLTEEGTPDRNMKLLRDFTYTDPKDKQWLAREGSVVNGASIPRALWTLIGSPYTGDYRRASIVHDVACEEAGSDKSERYAADRMFFYACRAGGCSIWQATILYIGVRIGSMIPDVESWHAAGAIEWAGPRISRTDEEYSLERDFKIIAERVLAFGETDNADLLESRFNEAARHVTNISFD